MSEGPEPSCSLPAPGLRGGWVGGGVKQASLSLWAGGMLAKPLRPSDEISKVQSLGFMLDS